MALGLRKNAEIQAIQTESLYAQPQSSFKPVQAWALLGGAILAVQLYIWAKWITGPYFVRVPAGPSDPPTLMKIVLVTWTGVIMHRVPHRPLLLHHQALASGTADHDRRHADGGIRPAVLPGPDAELFQHLVHLQHLALQPGFVGAGHSGMGLVGQAGSDDGGAAPHERARLLVRGPLVHDARMLGDAACQVALAEHRYPRVARRRVRVHHLLRRGDGGVLPDADGPLHVPRSHPVSLPLPRHATTSTRSTRHSSGVPSRPDSALSASSRTIAAGPSSSAAWNTSRVGS